MKRDYWSQRMNLKARIGVSAVVLTVCFVIILGGYSVEVRIWAFMTLEVVIWHWLR